MNAAPDYAAARAGFLAGARASGAEVESIAHPLRGPGGEDLATDIAWLGPPDAADILVIVSGTHGVEGHCGSMIQRELLARGELGLRPPQAAAMLIHAINPFGFAWDRRVTEDNVDLNRNFVDFAKAPQNAAYDELLAVLAPREWTDESRAAARATLRAYAGRHGARGLQQAVSGGQYRHPTGVFYGGAGPTWSRRTLTDILQTRLARAARVAVIDLHTGLGPEGYGERIVSAAPGTAEFARARAWYGEAAISQRSAGSVSAELAGDWLDAAPALLPRAEVTGIALEYGTVSGGRVLEALRADAWLHAHGDPRAPEAEAIRRQVRAAFYVDTDAWRGMVVGQAMLACRQALAGLAA